MWFERDLARQLSRPSLPVRIMVGPRQCGKSALIAHMKPEATWLSLDDIQVRLRAQEDPALLLETSGARPSDPVVLDEAAYAPNLFPEVKRRIDLARRRARSIRRLTSGNKFGAYAASSRTTGSEGRAPEVSKRRAGSSCARSRT